MAGREHLDPAQRGGGPLWPGPRVPRRRRRAPALADRRAGHEHRHRRRGRSRLEARRRGAGLGRREPAGELRHRAAADRAAQCRHDGGASISRTSKFDQGLAAIDDDTEAGRALRAESRPRPGARDRRDVPHHRHAARLPLRRIRRSSCRTAHRRCRIIRRTSSRRRGPARARRMWRSPMAAPMLDLYGRDFVLVRFGRRAGGRGDRRSRGKARRAAAHRHGRGARRLPRSTSASWCWCGPTATSPGAATACLPIRSP